MAISLGATSEQLLRGLDRVVAGFVSVVPAKSAGRKYQIPRAWASERGRDVAVAHVDVAGGFPAGLRTQHAITNTTVHLTDRWLIIGEGTNAGFALSLDHLVATSLRDCGGLQPPCLIVWYRDGDINGSFLLAFRGTSRNRAGMLRAVWMQEHLADIGVAALDSDTASFIPTIHCSWDDIADFADDEVLFSGEAIASVGGAFGRHLDSADVWLTENSLIWCAHHGEGVNRLDLESVISCRNGFGDRLAIGIEDACGGRYDLYFDLGVANDRSKPAARVQQLLAATGVPIGITSTAIAPWRSGGTRRPSDI